MSPKPTTAIFTQIEGAPDRVPGIHWQASLYLRDEELPFPVAIAWLSDYRNTYMPIGMIVDFVLVPDEYRRQGYATALIEACRERFIGLVLTDAISEAGEGFLESFARTHKERNPLPMLKRTPKPKAYEVCFRYPDGREEVIKRCEGNDREAYNQIAEMQERLKQLAEKLGRKHASDEAGYFTRDVAD